MSSLSPWDRASKQYHSVNYSSLDSHHIVEHISNTGTLSLQGSLEHVDQKISYRKRWFISLKVESQLSVFLVKCPAKDLQKVEAYNMGYKKNQTGTLRSISRDALQLVGSPE